MTVSLSAFLENARYQIEEYKTAILPERAERFLIQAGEQLKYGFSCIERGELYYEIGRAYIDAYSLEVDYVKAYSYLRKALMDGYKKGAILSVICLLKLDPQLKAHRDQVIFYLEKISQSESGYIGKLYLARVLLKHPCADRYYINQAEKQRNINRAADLLLECALLGSQEGFEELQGMARELKHPKAALGVFLIFKKYGKLQQALKALFKAAEWGSEEAKSIITEMGY